MLPEWDFRLMEGGLLFDNVYTRGNALGAVLTGARLAPGKIN